MSEVKSMITKDQLEKIQGFQKELNKILNEVGFLEAQKSAVLGELEEEYGSINIKLEDGTYEPIEKEEDKK